MILVIRISGLVDVSEDIQQALFRLRLRRKYSAVLLKQSNENFKLLRILRNHVAYGPINQETLKELIEKRASFKDKKIKPEEVINSIEKNSPENWPIKPFFRLHPPRKGIDSKLHFPVKKGVLGDNKEKINELVRRML